MSIHAEFVPITTINGLMIKGILIPIVATLVISLPTCRPEYSPANVAETLVDRSLHVTQYAYGYSSNYLNYVFFQNGSQRISNRFETIGPGNGTCRAYLLLPAGKKREITGSHKCYENSDGVLKEIKISFSREDLETYIKSNPPQFTIDGLQAWLNENRSKKGVVVPLKHAR